VHGDVPEVIRRSKLQTVLPENVEDESIARQACGKRGADVWPDFNWDKTGKLTKGF
jgi:hypothetical protein